MVDRTRIYNWYISLVAAACMVLYGYDASVYNSVQGSDNWIEYFGHPSAELIGAVNTSYNVGAIVSGWFLGGSVADHFGRKWGMGVGCSLVIIATFVQTFSPRGKIGWFIFGRVIIGTGQGLALTAGPVYIGEMAPNKLRGRIMTFWQLFYSIGSFIAYWINYVCTIHSDKLGQWDWKTVIIFQMLVPVVILILLPFIPETPRWYIQNGNQIEQARNALLQIRETAEEAEEELLKIREAIIYERERYPNRWKTFYEDRSLRRRLKLAFIMNIGQQLTGQGTLNAYSTAIYAKIFPTGKQIALVNALNATFGIIFTLNAIWSVDRFGRKALLIIGALGMALAMFITTIIGLKSPDTPDGTKTPPIGVAMVTMLFIFMFFYKPSWGVTVWIWTAEIFSMNVRARAVGMSTQMQNVANAIFQQFFPTFLARCGFNTFWFFIAVNLLLAIFVFFWIPETKQVRLEEMDVLFGGRNHVEKGGDMLRMLELFGRTDIDGRSSGGSGRINGRGRGRKVLSQNSDDILLQKGIGHRK